jgi:hypothetical protein
LTSELDRLEEEDDGEAEKEDNDNRLNDQEEGREGKLQEVQMKLEGWKRTRKRRMRGIREEEDEKEDGGERRTQLRDTRRRGGGGDTSS